MQKKWPDFVGPSMEVVTLNFGSNVKDSPFHDLSMNWKKFEGIVQKTAFPEGTHSMFKLILTQNKTEDPSVQDAQQGYVIWKE